MQCQKDCGEEGIRTLGTLRYTRFPIVHLRPLGHPSWENDVAFAHRAHRNDVTIPGDTGEKYSPRLVTRRGHTALGLLDDRIHDRLNIAESEGFEPTVLSHI